MTLKSKVKLSIIVVFFRFVLINRMGRKVQKVDDDNKYPYQWRNDYMIRKLKKFNRFLRVKIDVKGWENVPKAPAILAPNHASGYDPVLVLLALENPSKEADAVNPQAVYLGKKELENNKLVRGLAKLDNAYFIDRNDPRKAVEVIDEMVAHAKERKRLIVIFPEGTRSKDGNVQQFKGGAFRAAKQHFLTVVPVTINNSPTVFDFARRKPTRVEVIFHKPIKPLQFMSMETTAIAKLVQTKVEEGWKKPDYLPQQGTSEKKGYF